LYNEGNRIKPGDNLLILEAMKMENILLSSIEGKVKKNLYKGGGNCHEKSLINRIE